MWRVLRNNDRTRRQVFVSSRRRCLSSSPHTIVSRRAWQEHLQRHPPPKPPPKPKPDDKPWPRNLQIAGYAMAAVFIPYSMAWFAASNAYVRDILRRVIPNIDELLRSHFGQEEHASTSYYERIQQGAEPSLYQLEGEPTFRERGQQAQVEALNDCDVKLRVQVMAEEDDNESSSSLEEKVVVLPGTTLARSQDILQAIGKKEGTVAIDFGKVVDEEEQEESTLQDDNDMVILVLKDDEYPLEHATHTYSMWHYMAPQSQDSSSPRMSSDQLEIAKLEHEIQQLERDLKDVNCTRDRDDMVRDLKDKRSSLRKQKWKRRLRLS